jgi:hypothetical protein
MLVSEKTHYNIIFAAVSFPETGVLFLYFGDIITQSQILIPDEYLLILF